MQGTILILDGAATNRIMLKVQLSSAYYHVVQSERLEGLQALVQRIRPDLIVTAMTLPDGDATTIRHILAADEQHASIPVIAVTEQNDQASRLRALASGIDDVLAQPLGDRILQARIRSLVSARNGADELRPRDGTSRALGFGEPAAAFLAPAQVALVTRDARTSTIWRSRLKDHVTHNMRSFRIDDMGALMSDIQPSDVIVIEVSGSRDDPGLRLLAELRARSSTRRAAIIAIPSSPSQSVAADALDRGAHDAMPQGFCPQELTLRLASQLQHKAQSDKLRETVRDGLRAAVLDPMTGLYNRRYALPHLARIVAEASETGRGFAVMLIDLDHFKQINDEFGHPAGDAVLTQTAARLRAQIRSDDLIARIGGEEFMIVMQDTTAAAAATTAEHLCRAINCEPFQLPGLHKAVTVTTSIGVVVGPVPNDISRPCDRDHSTTALIWQADQALYQSKGAGRNQVTMIGAAA